MLVAFPFAENKQAKLRPAIVVNTDLPEALLVLFVTSQNTFSTAYDVVLEPSQTNGLKVTSFARANRLTVISTEHIARRIGTLSSKEHTTVQEALLKLSKDF